MPEEISLPEVRTAIPHIHSIVKSLNLPPEVLADEEKIIYAWNNLPRQLMKVPVDLRDELLARMCVAISVGLFDSAVNYVWNSSIRNLRKKVKDFGFNVVKQLLGKEFNDDILKDLKDAELLTFCLKLNLITEEGYFFLDQNRDIRNNFSVAHLSIGQLSETELISFMARCIDYAISGGTNPKGVDIAAFITALKSGKFNEEQMHTWINRLLDTHDAQRDMLFGMLHGMYCDPSMKGEPRDNAINICLSLKEHFSSNAISEFLNRHYDYSASGDEKRLNASRNFFGKMDLITALNTNEQHNIISRACNNLIAVHDGWDNFHTEPPFAERLNELTKRIAVPDTAREQYVQSIVLCYIGNQYGSSTSAMKYYEDMIKNFSPKELQILFSVLKSKNRIEMRVRAYSRCREMFKRILQQIDRSTIPSTLKQVYDDLLKSL